MLKWKAEVQIKRSGENTRAVEVFELRTCAEGGKCCISYARVGREFLVLPDNYVWVASRRAASAPVDGVWNCDPDVW